MAVAELHKASTLGENHSPASRRYIIDRSTMRTSTLRKMWRDRESEGRVGEDKRRCPEKPYLSSSKCEIIESEDTSRDDANEIENECPQNQNQNQNRQPDDIRLHLHRSPSLDFPAKERVRKVFRDWGSKNFEGRTVYISRMNNFSRAQSVEENECKRVRIEVGDGSVDLEVRGKRSIRRIYGRQAVLDLLAKFVRERETEVDCLLENRFVSNFAHRQRIQSLLKGRFLRNQRFVEDEKQTSIAASELGLLRQSHSVSDIRKGFLSKSNNVEHVLEVKRPDSGDDIKYEEITDEFNEKFPNPQETFSEISHETEKLPAKNQEDSDSLNWQHVVISHESVTEDDDSQWHQLTSDEGIYVNSPLTTNSQESNPEWYNNNNVEEERWFGGNSNAFDWSDDDDDNDRKYELAQLTNRRTVSNLLQSDFGPKLNNLLMQSYIKRQNQAFDNESENEGVDSVIPFPQTQQQEKEIINGLRIDIDNLHQRMNEMQRMLEACMNMQLQLQQSVHQQLNSALNQSSCHLCCDNRFQSLPDRCGAHNHMYICSNCVEKINWSTVKESVRHP
ncbi:hypothetical protein LXL04_032985 [Taraxacum kok-saghyz]